MMWNTKSRLEELRDDLKEYAQSAHDMTHKALDNGRDFTKAEASEMADILDRIDKTQKAIVKATNEEQLKQQVADLSAMFEDGGGTTSGHVTRGKGLWSGAFAKKYPGFKELVPSGSVTVPTLSATVTPTTDKPEMLLGLIPFTRLDGTDQFSYLRETVRNHQAGAVAASGTKPTSVYSVEKIDDRARVVAHLSEPIPRQTLADAPVMQQYLNGALREGLMLELERLLLEGDEDKADEFDGLLNTSGVLLQEYETDVFTTCRKAITALQAANITPTAWALNPIDWENFELDRSEAGGWTMRTSDGQIPVNRAKRLLWGFPVALSNAVTVGECWLADWATSLEIKEREAVQIDWSENTYDASAGASDFQRNLVRFRAEGRWGLAVNRPGGIIRVELGLGS